MAPRVWDFQIDEFNEAEMAEHDVTPEEVWHVLNSNGEFSATMVHKLIRSRMSLAGSPRVVGCSTFRFSR